MTSCCVPGAAPADHVCRTRLHLFPNATSRIVSSTQESRVRGSGAAPDIRKTPNGSRTNAGQNLRNCPESGTDLGKFSLIASEDQDLSCEAVGFLLDATVFTNVVDEGLTITTRKGLTVDLISGHPNHNQGLPSLEIRT
jgi:hypothetical protein